MKINTILSNSIGEFKENILKLEDVSVKFANNENYTLNDISLIISFNNRSSNKSEIIALLGSNGSGKSTLLKIINGTIKPTNGTISFSSVQGDSINNNMPNIVTLTQNVNDSLFDELTVFENCILYKKSYKNKTEKDIIDICNKKEEYAKYLQTFNHNLYSKLDEKVANLSGGEKQALILALCINLKPEILLLDEHTSALDPKLAESIIKITVEKAKQYNITCIICTHNLSHAINFADRILAIKNGRIIKNVKQRDGIANDKIPAINRMMKKEDLMFLYD